MGMAPASISNALSNESYNVCSDHTVTHIGQADFAGTYKIESPGLYQITEDIIMCPDIDGMMPPLNSTTYPPDKGYWLGFFAAIAVSSDNVFLDLNGKSISMCAEMLVRQRYFAIIELGERPFKARQGPPQFKHLTNDFPVAKNCVVSDGTLGLSSHGGIHGVDNENIWIDRVKVRDFETTGIQFNGAYNVHISNTVVGPSLGYSRATQSTFPGRHGTVPGLATLSHAAFLLRIASTVGAREDDAFTELENSFETFVARFLSGEDFEEREQVFVNDHKIPDGSALYGILFHGAKIAIHDFSACSDADSDGTSIFGPVNVTNVNISRLKLKTDEVVHTKAYMGLNDDGTQSWKPVMGPAGDVFQFFRVKDSSDNYVGNVLSNAQIALGRHHREAIAAGMDPEELFDRFGGANIPAPVESWSLGEITFEQMLQDIGDGENAGTHVCEKDAMNHHNKGVMGLRLEHYSSVNLQNVRTEHLENLGCQADIVHCTADDNTYKGNDARCITMTSVTDACANNMRFDYIGSLNGYAYGVENRHGVEYSSAHCQDYHVRGISGDMGSINVRDVTAYSGMLESDSSDSDYR